MMKAPIEKADGTVEEKTVLNEDMYEFLKKFVTIILPAFSSLYFGLAQIWGLPAAEEVVGTCALVATFLGVILGISANRYNQSTLGTEGDLVITPGPDGQPNLVLALNDGPHTITDKKTVTFKVRPPV